MKSNYLPELSDLCNKVSMKLQHIDNHMPSQKLTEQYEKMKSFKLMLERIMQFLQMDKTCIRPALKDKLPVYERQIVTILNSQKRKPVQSSEQSAEQTPSCSTSRIHVDSYAQTGYPGASNLHEELYQMVSHVTILLALQGFQLIFIFLKVMLTTY
jgi:PAX-interacting protein 1